ncbi:putative outer membrane usher protein [Escherichia coli]|uniref:Putative outer membrane usher protein n=1 Tax=Escherichia coli TaxID=562 RepID=A0A376TWY1_ECOLX|nr:putative outer membrane usher protein [Escherichia coli]
MDNRTLFNAQGGNFTFNFLPLGAIDGMRIGSTLSYLNQAQSQQGTPVMVCFRAILVLTLIVMSNFWDRFISIVVRNLLIPVPFRQAATAWH